MNGQLLIFAGSFAAIAVLVTVSMLLGLGRTVPTLDEAEVRALAEAAYCGFDVHDIAIDRTGRAGLAADSSGQVLLIVPHGAHSTVRLLGKGTAADLSGSLLTIRIDEIGFPPAKLDLGETAEAWARRLDGLNA